MSRIAITGGNGRLGKTLVACFAANGHDVISIDRAISTDALPDGVETVQADLQDISAARMVIEKARADALIHLAAIAVPFSAPEDVILSTNTTLAMNVMSSAIRAGVSKVVTASSPTVIGYGAPQGWAPDKFPIDEETPLQPWHAYGLSKLVAEQAMSMLQRQAANTVHMAAFRPCFVIAPEEWSGAPTQQGHTIQQRLDDPALSAPALFNYVDARDVASFLELLLSAMGELPLGEVYFVGADDALAREPLRDLIPLFHPGTEASASELRGTDPAFSSQKAKRELGWAPVHNWRGELGAQSQTVPDHVRHLA